MDLLLVKIASRNFGVVVKEGNIFSYTISVLFSLQWPNFFRVCLGWVSGWWAFEKLFSSLSWPRCTNGLSNSGGRGRFPSLLYPSPPLPSLLYPSPLPSLPIPPLSVISLTPSSLPLLFLSPPGFPSFRHPLSCFSPLAVPLVFAVSRICGERECGEGWFGPPLPSLTGVQGFKTRRPYLYTPFYFKCWQKKQKKQKNDKHQMTLLRVPIADFFWGCLVLLLLLLDARLRLRLLLLSTPSPVAVYLPIYHSDLKNILRGFTGRES